ncbi:MAG: FTR1 family protein [Actinobacteria bacterium]|nr:FTR1 family protein [Actinomycetota bacterium]
MISSFVITLREGLEASLVVGIILAYLIKIGKRHLFKQIWLGVILAIVASLGIGVGVFLTAASFGGKAEQIFEGLSSYFAVAVLTYMIFWMRKQSTHLKKDIEEKINLASVTRTAASLVLLSFFVVLREGAETVLFLLATIRGQLINLVAALIGIVVAVAIGYLVYRGSRGINIKLFFTVTGLILIIIAAGLLGFGTHELNEAGLLPSIIEHVYDLNFLINEKGILGGILKDLFGYNANPSLSETVLYVVYLGFVLAAYFWPIKKTIQLNR